MQRDGSPSPQVDHQYPNVWPSSVPVSAGPWSVQTYPHRLAPLEGLTQQQRLPGNLPNFHRIQAPYPHTQSASNNTRSLLDPRQRPRRSSIMDSESLLPPSFWDGMPPLDDTASWCRSSSRPSEGGGSQPVQSADMSFPPSQPSFIASVNHVGVWSSTLSPGDSVLASSPTWSNNSQLSLPAQQHVDSTRPSLSIESNRVWHRSWSSPSPSYPSNQSAASPGIQLSEAVEMETFKFHQHLVDEHDLASSGLPSLTAAHLTHQQSSAYTNFHGLSREIQHDNWNGFAFVTQPQHYIPAQGMAWHSANTQHLPVLARDSTLGRNADEEPFWNSQRVRTIASTDSGDTIAPVQIGLNVVQSPESLSNQSSQLETEGSHSSADLSEIDADYSSGPSLANLTLSRHYQRYKSDEFLVKARKAGWSYRKIREKGKFSEKESTLRGRYRSLSKDKDSRVRKPVWTERDIQLLNDAVGHIAPEIWGRKSNRKAGAKANDYRGPWSRVANYIAENGGSYHFGNATCRKKWDEIQG